MTRSDIAKLSDEEAEIKMAQLLGYTDVRRANEPSSLLSGIPPKPDHANHRELIPSYCSDLNACTKFQENASSNYWHQLADDIGCRQYGSDILQAFRLIGIATARQRAEAFLATMGKDIR